MSNIVVAGVEPWGGRSRAVILDHTGPTSYATGGESLGQSAFGGPNILGLAGFYKVDGGLTMSGTYRVDCIYGGAGVRSTVKLKWTVYATGTEVAAATNLSGETVRLLAIGG